MLTERLLQIMTAVGDTPDDRIQSLLAAIADALRADITTVAVPSDEQLVLRACYGSAAATLAAGAVLAPNEHAGAKSATGAEEIDHGPGADARPPALLRDLGITRGVSVTRNDVVVGVWWRAGGAAELTSEHDTFLQRAAACLARELPCQLAAERAFALGQRLGDVLENSSHGVLFFRAHASTDQPTRYVCEAANRVAAALLGRATDGVKHETIETLFGERSGGLRDCLAQVLATGIPRALEIGPCDQAHAPSLTVGIRRTLGDELIVTIADRTASCDAARAVESAQQQADLLLDAVPAMVWYKDVDSRVLRVNAAVARAMGLPRDQIEGRTTEELYPDSALNYIQDDRAVVESRAPRLGIVEPVAVGPADQRWLNTDKIPIFAANGQVTGVLVVSSDITRLKRTEETLRLLAATDPLTQAANRTAFTQALRNLFLRRATGTRFAVLLMDFDRFKAVNDAFGHSAGDTLLRSIAARLRDCVKASDVVARLGGDEFAILLTDVPTPEQAIAIAERVRVACAKPHRLDGQDVSTTASIGVATSELEFAGWEAMMAAADSASFAAKARGRNRVEVVDADRLRVQRRQHDIQTQLAELLANDALEFEYQPVLDCESGRPRGVEVLARWPGHTVAPREFIPIAEQSDAIHALTRRVITTAVALAERPLMRGLFVAINLARREVLHPATAACLSAAIARSGMHPRSFVVEVCEETVSDARADMRDALATLRDVGVRVAVEDFGAGVASLRQLRELPLDRLKLAGSLIRESSGNRRVMAVVAALANLAANLQIEVAAEGIESIAELATLQALGIAQFQGHLRAPALPLEQLERFLESPETIVDPNNPAAVAVALQYAGSAK